MSSCLSFVTDFYLNQEALLSEENQSQNKIKKSCDPKLEKTNNKIKQETKNILNKKISYIKNSYIEKPYLIKNTKIIEEKQRKTLFGSSFLTIEKKGSYTTFKSSPLNVFSKLQKTSLFTKSITSKSITKTQTIYNSKKLILEASLKALEKNTKSLISYKLLILQKTKPILKKSTYHKEEQVLRETMLKKNEKSFLHNEQEKQEEQEEQEEQENNNDNFGVATFINVAIQKTLHCLSSLNIYCSNKKYHVHEFFLIKANISNKKIKQATIQTSPPQIPLPTIGIFALYYILTKQGILADQVAYSTYKQEINKTHEEISQTYEKRLQIIRENIEKEKAMARWGVLGKFISWLMSFMAVVTACVLIVSGVGAVMGAVILAAGLFSLTNSILEITNGWSKIGELLPIKNSDTRRKTLGIIKISIGIISLVLSIITIIWGGYSHALRALQSVTQAITGALTTGLGICIIGESISAHSFYYGLADLKDTERNLEKLYFKRKDLKEKVDWDLDHLEKLFEDIAYALDLHKETAMIDNSFYS